MMMMMIALTMAAACAGGESTREGPLGGSENLPASGSRNDSAGGEAEVFGNPLDATALRPTPPQPPQHQDKYFHFEMNRFGPETPAEGRQKKRKGIGQILVPIFMAIKAKLVFLSAFMAVVAFVALKGFWAGMTGLLLSKIVGLKVLLQSQGKGEEEEEKEEEEEEEHSSPVRYEIPHRSSFGHRREGGASPTVIYLNGDRKRSRYVHRFRGAKGIKRHHGPEDWNAW